MELPNFITRTDGRLRIDTRLGFEALFAPAASNSITEQLDVADLQIREYAPSIAQGALNNIHGAWFEWVLAYRFWNHFVHNDNAYLVAKLPNVTGFDIADLFDETLRSYILDLRQKVLSSSGVELVTSNPDFVIFDTRNTVLRELRKKGSLSDYSTGGIEFVDTLYQKLVGRCNFDTIVGFIASKTSFRPDRRLQIPHEGSLMKALYSHLVTREWILQPRGIKYYALACVVGEADRRALKTVATHSITTVTDLPKAAVDEVYQVNSNNELDTFLQEVITESR